MLKCSNDPHDLPKLTYIGTQPLSLENFFIGERIGPG
jgi:hypothetical protein